MTAEKLHFRCPQCAAINRIPAARLHDGPRCGECKAKIDPAAPPADVDDAALQRLIATLAGAGAGRLLGAVVRAVPARSAPHVADARRSGTRAS
jgi:hypothetical protein